LPNFFFPSTCSYTSVGLLIFGHGRRKGEQGAVSTWIFKFDIFLLNFQPNWLISWFRVGKLKFHHFSPTMQKSLATPGKIHCWSPLENILPTPMFLEWCHYIRITLTWQSCGNNQSWLLLL